MARVRSVRGFFKVADLFRQFQDMAFTFLTEGTKNIHPADIRMLEKQLAENPALLNEMFTIVIGLYAKHLTEKDVAFLTELFKNPIWDKMAKLEDGGCGAIASFIELKLKLARAEREGLGQVLEFKGRSG